MNYLKFSSALSDQYAVRTQIVASDLKDTVQNALDLGLPLKKLDNLRAVIATVKHDNPGIEDVAIVESDPTGEHIDFSTNAASVGSLVPAAWARAAKTGGTSFRFESSDVLGVGLPIKTAYGAALGYIVIEVTKSELNATRLSSGEFVFLASVIVAIIFSLLLAPLALSGMRRFSNRVAAWTSYAAGLYEAARRGASPPAFPAATGAAARFDGILGEPLVAAALRLAPDAPQAPAEKAELRSMGPASVSEDDLASARELDIARIKDRFSWLFLAGLLVATIVLSLAIGQRFEKALLPEFLSTGSAAGRVLASVVAKAENLQLPLDKVPGVKESLDETRTKTRGIAYVALTGSDNAIVAVSGTGVPAQFPATAGEEPRLDPSGAVYDIAIASGKGSHVHVGVDAHIIARLLFDSLYDVLTILIIVSIVAREILGLAVDRSLTVPLARIASWRTAPTEAPPLPAGAADEVARFLLAAAAAVRAVDAKLAGRSIAPFEEATRLPEPTPHAMTEAERVSFMRSVRFATFIFFLADAIPNSFVPILARDTAVPMMGLPVPLIAGLPIALFWLFSGLAFYPSTAVLEKFSYRRVAIFGLVVGILADILAALSNNVVMLIVARSVFAVGFSTMFMSAQSAFMDYSGRDVKTQGPGLFTSTVFLAAFCGTAFGGVAATQLGYRATFLIAAAAMILAAFFVRSSFGSVREIVVPREAPTPSRLAYLFANSRYSALLFLCALPNRLASIALGFYIAPLFLSTMNLTTSEIGRIVSIYALIMAFGTPFATKFVDKHNVAFPAVILGTLVAGAGMLALVFAPNAITVAIAMACMGIGQSFSIPSQVYLAPWVAGESSKVLGATVVQSVFRTVERAPAFAGPLLGAALATRYGFAGAIATYGAYVTGCGVVLAGIYAKEGLLRFGEQPKVEIIARTAVEDFS